MKILIIQLARLGDLYQTWPAARAVRRAHPGAEIHLLARPRFIAACEGLDAVDKALAMPTRETLEPLLRDAPDIEAGVERMGAFLGGLRAEGYDLVVNLSFSPLSSHVAAAASGPGAETRGYSRHADGHLAIPDDASAYFYAQVGPGRGNRVHVTDLFALVAGVDLAEEDWRAPDFGQRTGRILIHVGASDARKTLSPAKWAAVARALIRSTDREIALIGSPAERAAAEEVAALCSSPRLANLAGATGVREAFAEVGRAALLIGGDSGPMQMASLAGTPALCLSLPTTSFWETGPRSAGSRIFPIANESEIGSDAVAEEARRLLAGEPASRACAISPGVLFPYLDSALGRDETAFEWSFLRAIYMGEAFPPPPDDMFLLGCRRLQEVNQLAREQLAALRERPGDVVAGGILDRADELLTLTGRLDARVGVVVRWLETERVRVGPIEAERVIEAYDAYHAKLSQILALYAPPSPIERDLKGTEADGR